MTPRPGNIVHSEFLNNHLVEIIDNSGDRSLYFSGSILQSQISLKFPQELRLYYPRYMMSALLIQPEPARVLLIGIGAGALVRFLHHHFPCCAIDAVDHSHQIIKLALGFFSMPNQHPITLHCCDGFEFLASHKPNKAYDLILVDAFNENGMSRTIYTEEFFRLCLESLAQSGVLSCNLWSGNPGELTDVKMAIQNNSTSQLYLPVQNRGNIVALAFNTPVPWEKINRPKNELKSLSGRFGFDLTQIVRIAIRHNMPLRQRIGLFFH
jgi:spermidine synthase